MECVRNPFLSFETMLGCLRHKNLTWFSFKDGAVQILSESWFLLITYPMEASAIFSTETPIRRESCHGSKDWISFGGLLPLWLIWMKNVRGKSFKEMFRLAIYCLFTGEEKIREWKKGDKTKTPDPPSPTDGTPEPIWYALRYWTFRECQKGNRYRKKGEWRVSTQYSFSFTGSQSSIH